MRPFFFQTLFERWDAKKGEPTVSGDSARDLVNLTRTHDMLFCLYLCVSLHCICIGAPRTPCLPSAIPERFAGGLSCQGMTIRLTGCGLCQYGNTNPDFYWGTLFDHSS